LPTVRATTMTTTPPRAGPAPAALQVSGVFASSRGVLAEVVVDATPYLLVAG
jgi:hypothetical protein